MSHRKAWFVLLAVSSFAACDSSVTGPSLDAAATEALFVAAERQQVVQEPLLEQLFERAVNVIARTHGREAAADVLSRINRIENAAAEARANGDIELAHRLVQHLRVEMAEVVVRVLGRGVVTRAMTSAGSRLEALETRIERMEAASLEVPPRLYEVAEQAHALLAAARGALGNGEPAQALLLALSALDLLNLRLRG